MPFDQITRRLAEEVFTGKSEEIIAEQQEKKRQLLGEQARRSPGVVSGNLVAAEARLSAETAIRLIQAKSETLVFALEKAGLPFTENARNEITNEVFSFAKIKQRHAMEYAAQIVAQRFSGAGAGNLPNSLSAEVEGMINTALAKIMRELRIKRYETALDEQRTKTAYSAAVGKRWDAFISHASEDKKDFVEGLAAALTQSGLLIWYAETALTVGDSLRSKIDEGLAQSRFGIVVLSHHFFAKKWPQHELDGLFAREVAGAPGLKVILPIWHNISAEEVAQYSPLLGGRLAARSSDGMEKVVRQIRQAMGKET